MSDDESEAAIACTLEAGDFKARLDWIAALNSTSLRQHKRGDLRLELVYAGAAREEVLEMVRRERACCGFLTFEVRDELGSIHVSIVAPEAARGSADTLFEALQAKAPDVTSTCCEERQ